MTRELEFYATIEETLPVLEPLFARRAIAFSLGSDADPAYSVASSFAELRRIIDQGAIAFEIGVGDDVHRPLVDSVFHAPTGAMRYFFVDKVGGPFLGVRLPEHGIVDGIPVVRPGSIAAKSRSYTDRSYRNEIPDESVRHAFREVAGRVRVGFAKRVTRFNRTWHFSRSILEELRQGALQLRGPLAGFDPEVLMLIEHED